MNDIKVLLVEDHAILRSGLMHLLGDKGGIQVVGEAENGREAVQKVQQLHPDIVLMDIGMPEMNGMEATREIKKLDGGVKVLILTVHENEEYLLHALQAGASGYVLKKAACSDLINAIHAVANGDYFLHPSITKLVVESLLERPATAARGGGAHAMAPGFESLTDREREILKLVAEGYTCREIAESLYISVKTVETHKAHLMDKLDLHKRADLVHYAMRKGILQMDVDAAG